MRYTLAIAPNAPAWFSPHRLLLTVEGELVADVEYRPEVGGSTLLARLNSQPLDAAVNLLGRTCPTCGAAHALALCLAIEALAAVEPPPRAAVARLVVAELERAASHLAALQACFGALGLTPTATALGDLQRDVRAALVAATASVPATILIPGGLAYDLRDPATVHGQVVPLRRRLFHLVDRLIDQRRLVLRTVELGVVTPAAAEQFGLRGPLARSAGLRSDVRIDRPYAAYATFAPDLVVQEGGDVYARLVVLLLEALEALKLADLALADLPAGPWIASVAPQLPPGEAIGSVEAPRGAFHCRISADGRTPQVTVLEPAPQLGRLLARTLLAQADLDNAPLIALSTDPCSGCLAVATE